MSKSRPIKLVSLDTETIGLDGDIRRIAIYDGIKVEYGYTFRDIEPILVGWYKDGYSVHIYIHNAEFDLRKMLEIFEPPNVNWNATKLINGKYVRLVCKYYTIHDSFRILPSSLKDLSENFDVEHGKLDLWEEVEKRYPGQYKDHVDFLSNCDKDDDLYLEYLGYDVMSLYEVLQKIMQVSHMEESELVSRLSTASMAKYFFRTGYNGKAFKTEGEKLTDYEISTKFKQWTSTKILKNGLTYRQIENKIRESYFGGRTEVFTPHAKRSFKNKLIIAYHYDVNSLYPSVMINNEYPVGAPQYMTGEKARKQFETWLKMKQGLGFIKCYVYVPQQEVPPLPTNNGKLVFLTGHLKGTWTYTELEYAIKKCGVKIIEIEEVIHFKETFKIFNNFISTFYEMKVKGKMEGNKALEQLGKLIQNTGYGFYALIRDRDDVMALDRLTDYRPDDVLYVDNDLKYIKIKTDVESESVQVQIASYVTSYARLVLLDALKMMAEKGIIYYCDTDSIVCSEPMPNSIVDKLKLGFWDCENKLYEGIFLLPKVYYEEGTKKETIKFKGVTRDTQKTLDRERYYDLLNKFKSGYNGRELIEKNKELLRGLQYSQIKKRDANQLEYRDKYLNIGHTPKREFDYIKNCSKPWHMESLEKFEEFNLAIPVLPYEKYGNLFDTCT